MRLPIFLGWCDKCGLKLLAPAAITPAGEVVHPSCAPVKARVYPLQFQRWGRGIHKKIEEPVC